MAAKLYIFIIFWGLFKDLQMTVTYWCKKQINLN